MNSPLLASSKRFPTLHNEESAYEALQDTDFSDVTSACLDGICEEIRGEIARHAAVNLSLLLMPRAFVNASKRKERKVPSDARVRAADQVLPLLKKSELFSLLPDEALATLARGVVPVETEVGDVIIKEGDTFKSTNAKFAIWCVLDGDGEILKGGLGGVTAVPDLQVLCRFSSPRLLGDAELFTDEPRPASVRLTTECDCWCLSKQAVVGLLETLPQQTQRAVYNRAFLRKDHRVSVTKPVSLATIRSSFLFNGLRDRDTSLIQERLEPICVRAGQPILTAGDTATSMFFLSRGEAKGEGPDPRAFTPTGEASFGEMAFMFDNGKHIATVRAVTNCHLWELPYDSLTACMRHSSVQKAVYTNSEKQRLAYLEAQRPLPNETSAYFSGCVEAMRRHSIIGEVNTEAFLSELARTLEPAVYLPRQSILSAVKVCDRVLFFQTGRAQVQNEKALLSAGPQASYQLRGGDVVGLTLLAFHRWLFPVVAVTGCDVWTCDKPTFAALLHKHALHHAYLQRVKRALTVHTYLPLAVALGRRETEDGLVVPPVLHPIPGLPANAQAFYHFAEDRGSEKGGGSARQRRPPQRRRGSVGDEEEEEGSGKHHRHPRPPPSRGTHTDADPPRGKAKKCWIVEGVVPSPTPPPPPPVTGSQGGAGTPPGATLLSPHAPKREASRDSSTRHRVPKDETSDAPPRRPSDINAQLDQILQRQASMRELINCIPSMRKMRRCNTDVAQRVKGSTMEYPQSAPRLSQSQNIRRVDSIEPPRLSRGATMYAPKGKALDYQIKINRVSSMRVPR